MAAEDPFVISSHLMNPVFELDQNLQIMKVNDYGETYFGVSRKRLLYRSFEQVFTVADCTTEQPLNLRDYLDKGFFSALITTKASQATRRVLASIRPLDSETATYSIILYDEEVERTLDSKYKRTIADKEVLIVNLEKAHDSMRRSFESLRALALLYTFVVNGFAGYALTQSVKGIPSLLNSGSRYLLAGLALALYLWIKKKIEISSASLRRAMINSICFTAPSVGLVTLSANSLRPEVISFCSALAPMIATFFGFVLLKRKPTPYQIVAIVLTPIGTWLVVSHGFHLANPLSFVLIFASVCVGAIGALYSVSGQVSYVSVLAFEQIVVGSCLMLASHLRGETFTWSAVSEGSLMGYVYLLVFATLGSLPATRWLLKTGSPTEAVSFFLSGPTIGMLVGCLSARRFPSLLEVTASIVIGTALYLTLLRKKV